MAWDEGESRQFNNQGTRHRITGKKHILQGDDYLHRIDDNNKIEFVAGSLKFTIAGEVYELNPTAMSTSYEFKAGHRIRVEVASSKFPQYMRNLNTGGNNYDETESVTAHNSVHHSNQYPSQITLPVRR